MTELRKLQISDSQTGKIANVDSLGNFLTNSPIRLVGTTFGGSTKDTNFWTETVTGTGNVTQNGEITLSTGTTADSTTKYESVRKSRKVTGTANQFRSVARNVTIPQENNVRRIGPYDENNGFFMQFDGTTFGVGSRKSGVDIVVENGSFNGNAGATIEIEDTSFTRIIMEYTSLSCKFFVNDILIHTILATTTSLTESLDLSITIENNNTNGNITDNSYEVLFATILRLGNIVTNSKSYYNAGTTTGVILKYGAGSLRELIVGNVSNNAVITLYDNTAASGSIIWSSGSMGAQTQPYGLNFNGLSFDNGLTLVVSTGANLTVIYE